MKQKTVKIIYWIVTILFALFMLFSGIMELINGESAQKALTDLGYPIYLNYILGVAKILGCIVIVTPMFNILKEWAYAGFTIDLVGAAASIALMGGSVVQVLFMAPFIIVLFLSYGLWKKTN